MANNIETVIDDLINEAATRAPDMVAGIYKRDYARSPPRLDASDDVGEVEFLIRFSDGDVMIFGKIGGQPFGGIILPREAVWALKARA